LFLFESRPRRRRIARLVVPITLAALAPLEAQGHSPAAAGELAESTSFDLVAGQPAGLSRLLTSGTPSGRGIATFDTSPTALQVQALESLGLTVQPMRHLPLALVAGPVDMMRAAVTTGVVADVYPDERLELLDTASSDSMGSAQLRAAGLTGKGVTVGVVDSGCDATHADLANRVEHNVSLVSAEYVNATPDSSNTIVVPVDQGPYSNTDLGGGHGTHVAGIIAADSSSVTDGSRYGVAPGVTLQCFSIGPGLLTTAVVTAYDHMLDQDDMWGIDVVNNSWGNVYRQFDPRDPVAVATKAVADQGVTVVFAAGNWGGEHAQMTMSPYSQAPWVIAVAAADVNRVRGYFSSNGLVNDNSQPTQVSAGGHTVFTGDRIGLAHPDITAPGVAISATCALTGTIYAQVCTPDGNVTLDGTSMASPHIAGAAAVLKQAKPVLTPTQVRQALQASAVRIEGGGTAFWQVGYGFADLDAAVALVTGRDWAKRLAKAVAIADARVLAQDGVQVPRADFWTYDSPHATAGGTDNHVYAAPVGLGVTGLRVALSHPSLASACCGGFSYVVTVKDPAGKAVGTTTESITQGGGTATAYVDLTATGSGPGTYTFEVSGEYAASDPDTVDSDSALGRMVTLHVAQVKAG